MMDVRHLRQSRKHKNYISALVAVNKTGEALESVTEHGLQTVHNHIQQNLGHLNLPMCVHLCSRNTRDLNRWCLTCTSWRIELDAYILHGVRQNRIRWVDMKSWTWPVNGRTIAEVFILPGWNTNNINLKDLTTTLAVWKRCSFFQRHVVNVAEPLKTSRNQLAHEFSATMKITNAKKNEIFQNIRNVIGHPDIQPFIQHHNNLVRTIGELEQGGLFRYENDIMNALRDIGVQNEDIQGKLDRNALGLQEVHTRLANVGQAIQQLRQHVFRQGVLTVALLFILAVVSFLGLFYFLNLNTPDCRLLRNIYIRREEHNLGSSETIYALNSTEGCLPENLSSVKAGRVHLFEYVSHHQKFTGRKWLFTLIEKEILSETGEHHGMLLEAGMGYGKSAVMKQIICSTKNSSAYKIRSRLVAFHICRFDVTVSKQAYIFIFRLVAMFSAQMPDVGNTMRECLEVFDKDLCERDPNGCVDQCIIIPLKNLANANCKPVIIIIDGLDECYNSYRNENEIYRLLKYRIHKFPFWVRFLITSRIGSGVRFHEYLKAASLKDNDFNNLQDIQLYLKQSSINTSEVKYMELANSNMSNFLIASSLSENFQSEIWNIIPRALDQYYDEQFRRQFKATSKTGFEDARILLEVLCSSFQTVTEETLWNIIFTTTRISKELYRQALKRLEPFMHYTGSDMHFKHISLQNWLLNTTNDDFFVNSANGHNRNALYIFEEIEKANYDIDVVDLAIHVSYSGDNNLVQKFRNISEKQRKELQKYDPQYPLLRLARRVDDFLSTDMLASHFNDVDRLDRNNVSALFIAAYMGHLHTFKALLKSGSNITFRSESFHCIIDFESAFLVSFEHKFWGYGILDIAAQNGHIHLVDYIIENNGNLFQYPMKKMNAANLLPIHLACKRGYLNVVKRLQQQFPYMLDWLCLYYASELGNKELVEFILNVNVTDRCSRCESYFHWIPDKKLRVQGQIINVEDDKYEYVLFDDWNKITCESALHVAVREHKIDVVKILARQLENAVNCFDRGGRTPAIVALQFGYRDIVEYFARFGLFKGNEACGDVPAIRDPFNLNTKELEKLQGYLCEPFRSIFHIAAKFNRLWLDEALRLYNIKADWYSRDNNGCYPVHVAACHNNIDLLLFFAEILEENMVTYRCHNGSTPLHSAVVCASVSATEILLLKYRTYKTESNEVKMSYLKHVLSIHVKSEIAKDTDILERNISEIVSMLFLNESDLHISDEWNRNILHLAISKGHFHTVRYLYSNYPDSSKSLLNETDENGKNPLKYAIDHMQIITEFRLPSIIFRKIDIFNNSLDIMRPEEYTVLLTLDFLKSEISYKTLFKRLVRKQCLHLVIYIFSLPHHPLGDASTLPVILQNDRSGLITLVYYLAFTEHFINLTLSGRKQDMLKMPLACSTCEEILFRCHSHQIAIEYLKIANLLSRLNLDIINSIILQTFFHIRSAKLLSTCYDKAGYNVLERAIQGGSPQLVLHLLDLGVDSEIRKDLLLYMALNTLQYRKTEHDFIHFFMTPAGFFKLSFIKHEHILRELNLLNPKRQYFNRTMLTEFFLLKHKAYQFEFITYNKNFTDWLLSTLIRRYHSYVNEKQICHPRTKHFSFIHRLLFEGLLNSIELAVKYWGTHILECQNADDFTPLYLYKLFHNTDTDFNKKYGTSFIYPKKEAELFLLFHLQFRFIFSNRHLRHFSCLIKMTHIVPTHTYSLSKIYTCIRKFNRITKSKEVRALANKIKWALSFITEIDTWGKTIKMFKKMYGMQVSDTDIFHFNLIFLENYYTTTGNKFTVKYTEETSAITDQKFAFKTRIIDLGTRMCAFLRKSLIHLISYFKENARNCKEEYQNFAEFLRNLETYQWNVDNCTGIHIAWNHCFKNKVTNFVNIASRGASYALKNELINMALNQSIYLPFATIGSDFKKMLLNVYLRMHLFKYYSYMEELEKSQIFRESYMYKSKNLPTFSKYVSHLSQNVKFLQWQRNARQMFEEFLEGKNMGL